MDAEVSPHLESNRAYTLFTRKQRLDQKLTSVNKKIHFFRSSHFADESFASLATVSTSNPRALVEAPQ